MKLKSSKLFLTCAFLSAATLTACQSSDTRSTYQEKQISTNKSTEAQEEQGVIQRFLISARGDLDGMMLEGGVQVNFTPVMAERVKKLFSVNDTVLVKGYYENDRVFRAEDIKNIATGRRVSEQLSPPPTPVVDDLPNYLPPEGTRSKITKTPGPSHHGLKKISAEGTIQNRLYGKFGEVAGVVLSDGTIVHFKPDVINTMDINPEVGAKLKASGYGSENKYGRAIDATEVIRE